MKEIQCEQRSDEWYSARCGVPTASNFDKIVTSTGKPSKQKEKYLYKIAGEYVSGKCEESYQNDAMIRGCEMEDEARKLYEMMTDFTVRKAGFCIGDPVFEYGASPDGFVDKAGLIEIKCPSISVHVEYVLGWKLPTKYIQQVQGQLLVTGRDWCDFISYYPGLKPMCVRVFRDEAFIQLLRAELETFCGQLKDIIKKIK